MAAEDLVTISDAKTFLKLTGSADDGKVAALITRASAWAEQITLRKLRIRAYTNLRFTGPSGVTLRIHGWPIATAQTVTVKLDEVTQTVWRTEADGDIDDKDVVVASDDAWDTRWGKANHLYRSAGWGSGLGRYWGSAPRSSDQLGQHRVLLSYTGGYDPVPEDLQQATFYLLQKLWRDQEKQQTGLTVINLPTGGSVSLPETGIPREAMDVLSLYARPVLGAV